MKKIIIITALVAVAIYYKQSGSAGNHASAYSSTGDAEVKIFTFDNCGAPCNNALALLDDKSVPYDYIDLTNNKDNQAYFQQLGGGNSLPVTFVGQQRVDGFDRTKLTHALAVELGLEYLDWPQREVIAKHFDVSGAPMVVMYATQWCGYCKKARAFFADENIEYQEIDVENSEQGGRDYAVLQSPGYPLIYIGANRFTGLNKQGIKQTLRSL